MRMPRPVRPGRTSANRCSTAASSRNNSTASTRDMPLRKRLPGALRAMGRPFGPVGYQTCQAVEKLGSARQLAPGPRPGRRKATHRPGDRSGGLLPETPFRPVQGAFNSLTWRSSSAVNCCVGCWALWHAIPFPNVLNAAARRPGPPKPPDSHNIPRPRAFPAPNVAGRSPGNPSASTAATLTFQMGRPESSLQRDRRSLPARISAPCPVAPAILILPSSLPCPGRHSPSPETA